MINFQPAIAIVKVLATRFAAKPMGNVAALRMLTDGDATSASPVTGISLTVSHVNATVTLTFAMLSLESALIAVIGPTAFIVKSVCIEKIRRMLRMWSLAKWWNYTVKRRLWWWKMIPRFSNWSVIS